MLRGVVEVDVGASDVEGARDCEVVSALGVATVLSPDTSIVELVIMKASVVAIASAVDALAVVTIIVEVCTLSSMLEVL